MKTPYLHRQDDSIIAIACDAELSADTTIPVLDINDVEAIARYIYEDFYLAA